MAATLGVLAAVLGAPSTAVAGHAASSQHKLIYCYGRVTRVVDGDTVNVHLTTACPGGRKGHLLVVRDAGIQATEISHAGSKPDCWSAQGRAEMRSLIPVGTKVRLSSYYATLNPETDEKGRPRYIKYVDGWIHHQWVDVQQAEIRAGDAMFKEESIETARLAPYMRAEQEAMYDRDGMWGNPAECSSGYDQGAQFQSWIVWKTDGPDKTRNAHEESFDVKNVGTTTVNLSHWKVRDASRRFGGGSYSGGHQKTYLVLPAGTELAPGKTLVIHPAHGHSEPGKDVFYDNGHDYAGHSQAFFPNAVMGHGGRGAHPHKGAPKGGELFLLDPALDFRAWAAYPCVYKCGMPPRLTVSADPGTSDGRRQRVTVTNRTSEPVNLLSDVVDFDSHVKNLRGVLLPGKTLTIHCQGHGKDSGLRDYWNGKKHFLSLSGGTVWLRTANDVTISKYSWGNGGHYRYHH